MLSDANLTDADLSGATLSFCNVRFPPFSVCVGSSLNADLKHANLSGVQLAGVALSNADLTGSNLTGDTFIACGDGCYGATLGGALVTGTLLVPADQTAPETGTTTPLTCPVPAPLAMTPTTCDPPSGSAFLVGTPSVTCSVSDLDGNIAAGTFTVDVQGSGSAPLSITTTSPAGGSVGEPYLSARTADGGNPPYAWKLVAGSGKPPRGLRLNGSTGVISGTPGRRSTTSTFTEEVLDTKTATRPHTRNSATAMFTIPITWVDWRRSAISCVAYSSGRSSTGPTLVRRDVR